MIKEVETEPGVRAIVISQCALSLRYPPAILEKEQNMLDRAILFVDDEPNILSGLKRMLRSMRKEMDFYFAENGPQALDILSKTTIHVVVSDMRMPGMNGAELLAIVQDKHPQIIRIMLSGQADEEMILKTVGVVHQFMHKPSDSDTLKRIFSRACALQSLMINENLKTLVSSLGSLPSLPSLYVQVQQVLKSPDYAVGDVAAIIEQDMAMSAKVLQLVNSAFFGLFNRVDSPAHAVKLLGMDTIKALVLCVGVFSELKPAGHKSYSIKDLWSHSVAVAAFAKTIAMAETDSKETIGNSFIAGIIHDIGKLLLFTTVQEQYVQAVEAAREEPFLLAQAEQQLFSADHGDVGGYLIGVWGLPGEVVEAIAFHHRLNKYPGASFSPAIAVQAADVIYYMLNPDQCVGKVPVIDEEYLNFAGLSGRFEHWLELCKGLQP
ncbi:MAG: response regulator [Gammaproteobacteria bacterium]|nr:response regulator [Gammaproteobacteria bacterium]